MTFGLSMRNGGLTDNHNARERKGQLGPGGRSGCGRSAAAGFAVTFHREEEGEGTAEGEAVQERPEQEEEETGSRS